MNLLRYTEITYEFIRMPPKSPKIVRRPLSGVFLLNKPLGISSNAALQKVRWLFRAEKGGHTGALDPLASGLLPICLGEATKFSHYLLDSTKRYQTKIQLGHSTTTGDVEGDVLLEAEIPVLSEEKILNVLDQFLGDTTQIPPMYSALKKEGRPLYELARKGIEIEREALLLPAYAPVEHFPRVQIPEGRTTHFCNGLESNISHPAEAQVLVFDGEKCLGLAEITDKFRLVPKRVLKL